MNPFTWIWIAGGCGMTAIVLFCGWLAWEVAKIEERREEQD